MWIYRAMGWIVVSLAFYISAPLSMAAEVANTSACDKISTDVRKGRPGVDPVNVIDGKGPTSEMSRTGLFSAAAKPTGKLSKEDERNLCLAISPITNPESRYKHKDHSNYYCTLILNRDSQTFCYAVVQGNPNSCGNIVSGELEKECLTRSK
ncbi:MAG: hypothetical protein HN472_04435 [Nitrospina sp.]|jgi:hypothetical protein|nr:hypothetical protein [Nitrospina sp.]MBT3508776.1 hypothetical protein [Nitrospina sp.]MBT4047066.1 hypothetical protein [Nitrospina sp.]MBT5348442.1 hypothetical protein [Nitrospina sp.]MBT5651773.1 hypothetical protein [Nitrospina sp.]